MLSQTQRTADSGTEREGSESSRDRTRVATIASDVRKVLTSNSTQVPEIQRAEKAEPYRQQILDLLASCKGNLVRVHEELTAAGAALSYPALTAFCRRQGIGQTPVVRRGPVSLRAGRGDAARHVAAHGGSGRQ